MSLLKVDDIHVYYGAIHAIKGVSFEVGEGEIVALIGGGNSALVEASLLADGCKKVYIVQTKSLCLIQKS